MNADIRWIQRFNHFTRALEQLKKFIAHGELNEFETQGLIKSFEYTYELAWKTIKDYFEEQGETNITGSRDAIRLAFQRALIENGELWMEMLKTRNLTSHTYNEDIADEIAHKIVAIYFPMFIAFYEKMKGLTMQ